MSVELRRKVERVLDGTQTGRYTKRHLALVLRDTLEVLAAERAYADELAEALRKRQRFSFWAQFPPLDTQQARYEEDALLRAHDERRAG